MLWHALIGSITPFALAPLAPKYFWRVRACDYKEQVQESDWGREQV